MNQLPPNRAVLLTPESRGAVASVRIEGPRAAEFVERHFPGPKAPWVQNRVYFGRWNSAPNAAAAARQAPEEVVVSRLETERVEVHCHGGAAAARRIMGELAEDGCEIISSREWIEHQEPNPIRASARALLAEASTERTAMILLDQYNGALTRAIDDIIADIRCQSTQRALAGIDELVARSSLGMHLIAPWRVVIAGPPNAGKSSLINALVGYQRAIVHERPGTTRDAVGALTAFDGWPVELIDTAGLRTTADPLENAGIDRAGEQIAAADAVLFVFDMAETWAAESAAMASQFRGAIVVHNKMDLLEPSVAERSPSALRDRPPGIAISARTGSGIDRLLREALARLVGLEPPAGAAVPFLPSHLAALAEARRHIERGECHASVAALGSTAMRPASRRSVSAELLWTRGGPAAIFPTPVNMPESSTLAACPTGGSPGAGLLFKEEHAMGNDVRIRKARIGLKLTRGRLLLAALLAGLLLPLGIMALARCHADDHAASNAAAPGLMPLPPTPSPASQVPVAPSDAAKTTASDDASASQALPAAPLSTGMPPITLPPPLQPSAERPLPGPDTTVSDQKTSLHADVLLLNDWSLHTVSAPTAASKKTPGTGPVTPASAAIADVPAESAASQSKTSPADELPELPPLEVEGARFKEIQPGVTTSGELIDRWGEGKLRRKNGGVERIYELEHYPKVVVSLQHRRVSAIDVQLDQPTEPETLARRFHFDPDSSVPVVDDAGQPLGQSFPDRGTLFSYDPGTKLVSQILIEPIDPQPFLARANYEAELHPGWGLRDVDYALSLDGKQATAHDMRSRMLLAVGRPGDALRSANRSISLAPDNAAFLLNKAAILARLDHRDDALRITRSVAERSDLPALVKARARCQLAELSAGPNGDDKRAIELYMSAIKTAQPLASDEHAAVRRLAKHLLLEAHLGAASDIAWGVWQRKPATVARWIEQADQLAQDLVEHENADPQVRLDVARLAVSVSAGTDGKWDCTDWIQQALDTGRKLIADADDPLRKQALEWELGAALLDALEVQRTKGLNAESLAHAMAVLRYLQSGIQYRQRTAETTYVLGRAYFQIGMIHAVVDRDHTTAVLWFDRALPFLDRPLPPSAASRIGRHGELLVGMGISYWKTGHHEEALRLTQRGADLMSKAVAMKLLNGGTLAVPYRNLASMHRQMGHSEQARSYSEMAAEHDTLHR